MKLVTFGYRYKRTEPIGADVVFDARCLREDPAEKQSLGPLTGKDSAVQEYLSQLSDVQEFIYAVSCATLPVVDRAFTIAIGCHSGRHRSVYIAERVGLIVRVKPIHLDIDRVPCEDLAPDCV